MSVTRRSFFNSTTAAAAAASVDALAMPNILKARHRRISQSELTAAIEQHAVWLEDGNRGKRAVFSDCDLTGLTFHNSSDAFVNLRGSDFTGADLTGVIARDISFLWASLQNARLSWSRLEKLTFSHANLRCAECDNVLWGWDATSLANPGHANPCDGSSFQYTYGGKANFARAAIRGFFHEAHFAGCNFADARLSYSEFCGTGFSASTFYEADLTRTKFNFAKLSHVRFRHANCTYTDFTNAEIGYHVTFPAGLGVGAS
ncbi:pentapeptide repeat-containing protein [Bradyrhizobium sp. AZCC 2289]|uniref:pentapeptide repeat-containing protein n=1 Tax=Bradyrhizobium sp. AZCC 2289 TaxID=3117026 RepID=UPI002FF28174